MSERGAMLEVQSSELETRLSSSDDLVEVEEDIIVFVLREVRAFHAPGEVCSLDDETLSRFKGRFQFPDRVRICLPREEERDCHFSSREVSFYEAAFLSGLRFLVHPFIIELLGHCNIAPRQLMPNSWRIVISYMGIWLAAVEGDMVKVDEFTYLYRLKESKEYGYYELVPWTREARTIRDLPSSFKYWKSQFFFMSGDGWETLSDKV